MTILLIEYIPLQQGLRPYFHNLLLFIGYSHWVYSITTRIKTGYSWAKTFQFCSHWVYSITTRIKTNCLILHLSAWVDLIEYIPLQQGLRPCKRESIIYWNAHWVYSITTRIKTSKSSLSLNTATRLIEYIPLQQGLRHWNMRKFSKVQLIEYIPLQQGLRHLHNLLCQKILSHWVYSITTRIKTLIMFYLTTNQTLIEYIPLQQGLRPTVSYYHF